MRTSRIGLIFILPLPVALAQDGKGSANRGVTPPAAASTSPTSSQPDLVGKVLGLIGPAKPTPFTPKKRLKTYVLNTAGPGPLIGAAASAGIRLWADSPKEWGQGWNGFGHRYGSSLAYNGVRKTIAFGTAFALHEDGRYFAAEGPGFWRRTRHALLSTFTARRRDGTERFAVSTTAGIVGASAVSRIWAPNSKQGPTDVAQSVGITLAATAGFNVMREFLPGLLHRPVK